MHMSARWRGNPLVGKRFPDIVRLPLLTAELESKSNEQVAR